MSETTRLRDDDQTLWDKMKKIKKTLKQKTKEKNKYLDILNQ